MYGMVCKLMMKFSIFLLVCTLWWCIFSRADGGVANILMLYDAPSEVASLQVLYFSGQVDQCSVSYTNI